MASILDPQVISLLVAIVVSLMILALGLPVVRALWTGRIDLTHLISEPVAPGEPLSDAKASLSRFQFLVFTFVIAGLYLVLSLETGNMIDVPQGTLILIGISGSTYVAGKALKGTTAEPETEAQKKKRLTDEQAAQTTSDTANVKAKADLDKAKAEAKAAAEAAKKD